MPTKKPTKVQTKLNATAVKKIIALNNTLAVAVLVGAYGYLAFFTLVPKLTTEAQETATGDYQEQLPKISAEQYQKKVSVIYRKYQKNQMQLESIAPETIAAKTAEIEQIKKEILDLSVPADFMTLHLSIASSFSEIKDALTEREKNTTEGDTEAQQKLSAAHEKLSQLAAQYTWLNE